MSLAARNIEIKARARTWARQISVARSLADIDPLILKQTDTFFNVPKGRLKLRQFPQAPAELIGYFRPDATHPSPSDYTIFRTDQAEPLLAILASALGVRGKVIKTRTLLRVGQTRIHFDDVAHLGFFIELEVVLVDGQSAEEGRLLAEEWMKKLDIREEDLLTHAYVDLLQTNHTHQVEDNS